MNITKETERKVVDWECEFSEDEEKTLLAYAVKNMVPKEHVRLLMEWAFLEILKKQLKEEKKLVKKKDKK